MTSTAADRTAAETEARVGATPQRCVRHPNRETLVSCGRCGRPFCPECLIHTPAGQRCYECAGVRRRAAGAAVGGALLKGFVVIVLGAAIGSLTGLLGILIGAATGDMAGRMVGPSVNRHTRRVLFPVCAVLLLLGTAIGWTLPILVRLASTGRLTVADLVFVVFAVSMTLFRSITFWLFLVVTGAVAYQRVR